jgi:hypothetical protein
VAALYRLWQFWEIVRARPLSSIARQEVAAILNPAELRLFEAMSASDQQHSYRVAQTLRRAGHHQPDLLAAALLHDAGKSCARLTVADRTLIVLAEALWPHKTAAWGKVEGKGGRQRWRRPFVVKARHPEWSESLAAQAGSRPLTLTLIRRHQDSVSPSGGTAEDELLRLLQWADNQN